MDINGPSVNVVRLISEWLTECRLAENVHLYNHRQRKHLMLLSKYPNPILLIVDVRIKNIAHSANFNLKCITFDCSLVEYNTDQI